MLFCLGYWILYYMCKQVFFAPYVKEIKLEVILFFFPNIMSCLVPPVYDALKCLDTSMLLRCEYRED